MHDTHRRLLLRLSVKLMFLLGFAAVIYVLLSPLLAPDEEQETKPQTRQIRLDRVDRLTINRIPWAGGNLLLLQLPPQTTLDYPPEHALHNPAPRPMSGASPQAGLFLAYDRGTDMGCPLQWLAPGHHPAPLQPWPGGFRDSCRGSWYDAAGRVLRDQEAKHNLAIPPYRLLTPDLLEVGVNGDNPSPAE